MPTRKPTPTRKPAPSKPTQPSKSASANMNAAIKARSKPMTAAQQKASMGRSVVTGKGYPKHDPLPPPGRKPGSGPAKTTADPRRANSGAVLPKQRLEYTDAATATAKPTSRKSTAAEPTRRIVKSNYVVNRPIPKAKTTPAPKKASPMAKATGKQVEGRSGPSLRLDRTVHPPYGRSVGDGAVRQAGAVKKTKPRSR